VTEKERLDSLTEKIIGAAIRVHRRLGPGLLEAAYHKCLSYELRRMGLAVIDELDVPIVYDDLRVEPAYRIDLLVEDLVVVELKAEDRVPPIHFQKLTTYLRFSGKKVSLLINFNVPVLRQGIKRIVLNYPD